MSPDPSPEQYVDDGGNVQGGEAGQEAPSLMSKWNSWLSKPENRSMLIQSGLAMMQPRGPGESAIGHIGEAVGGGLEARDALQMQQAALAKEAAEQARIQQQTESEGEYRSAGAAELRARAKYYEGGGAAGSPAKTDDELRKQADDYQNTIKVSEDEIQNENFSPNPDAAKIARLNADITYAQDRRDQIRKELDRRSGVGSGEGGADTLTKAEKIAKIKAASWPSREAMVEFAAGEGITEDDLK